MGTGFRYNLTKLFVRGVFALLARIEVDGLENVPPSDPFVLVINHVHFLDPPLVLAVFPRRITVLIASDWKRWPIGVLPTALDAIYVDRGQVDRQALRQCLEVLEEGGVLGMSPEGTRSHAPGMQRARPGVAYIAYKAEVPIVPVAIVGMHKVFSAIKRLQRTRVRLTIGSPFRLPAMDLSGPHRNEQLKQASDEIMYRLARQLPPEYRGVYQLDDHGDGDKVDSRPRPPLRAARGWEDHVS